MSGAYFYQSGLEMVAGRALTCSPTRCVEVTADERIVGSCSKLIASVPLPH